MNHSNQCKWLGNKVVAFFGGRRYTAHVTQAVTAARDWCLLESGPAPDLQCASYVPFILCTLCLYNLPRVFFLQEVRDFDGPSVISVMP